MSLNQSIQQEVIKKMSDDYRLKVNQIINQRLFDYGTDLDTEIKNGCSNLSSIHESNKEVYFFKGKRLVTFYQTESPINIENNSCCFTLEFNYF